MVNFEIFLLILSIAVAIVWILRRLHLPPILGYLLTGVVVGPFGYGLLESQQSLSFIAEFGVVFLLFTIGLELSIPKLISMRRSLLGLGGLQVLLCTALVIGVSLYFGLSLAASIAIAGAITFSSTAVATKQLIEQDELHQEHGKISLGILLFQDLAAVPFLIIIPALGIQEDVQIKEALLNAVIMGSVVFIGMLAAGRWLLRPLFHNVAHAQSTELFMLTGILVVLVSAFITEHVGLSLALGAFLAGVMLAETKYVHQIEADILPFRDILLGLFFITVGMKLDVRIVLQEWLPIFIIVTSLILVKTLVIALLGKISGASTTASFRAGITLAQGGEFGFALLSLAAASAYLDNTINQILIGSIIISIAISPILIRNSARLAAAFLPIKEEKVDDLILDAESKSLYVNHVIICGYGRVGQTLARFLEYEGITFIGLDLDPIRLREARAANEPVFYGDSTDQTLMLTAGIEKAKLLIIAYDDDSHSQKCVHIARRLNPKIPILVRTADDRHLEQLQHAGATEVISDKLESSLMLASHMLMLLGTSPEKARQQVWEVKTNRYKLLQAHYASQKDHFSLEEDQEDKINLHAVEISKDAYIVNRTIEEFVTEKMPIQLASFSRNGFKCDYPAPFTTIKPDDILLLMGTIEELYLAEEKLLQG